ncbi:uncharacterized protein LOC134836521 [Culicoides brevitarsis]|uniref:uncharacterized protein LOC134836521 n=1 Tax=Culicoides brevitarsis TaxID=469753 RepID=UPI00307BA3BB
MSAARVLYCFSTIRKHLSIPALYLSFPSERDELELNLLMKHGVVQRHRDRELLRKHGITKECSVSLQSNNHVLDWGYMALYDDSTTLEVLEKKSAELVFKNIEKHIARRNDTMIRLAEIKKVHKGKFIMRHQLDFDIIFYFSNYFDLMFKYLTPQQLQSDEASYSGIYFENWFNNDWKTLKKIIPNWQEYKKARSEWKLNDEWVLVEDENEFYKERFKMFLEDSNVTEIVKKYYLDGRTERELAENFYKEWCNGTCHEEIIFKTVLTYEKFRKSNVLDIVISSFLPHYKENFSLTNVERVLRRFFNEEIVNATSLSPDIKFIDGTTVKNYHIPTIENKVCEFHEVSELEEKDFIDIVEAQEVETVENIENWLKNDTKTSTECKILKIIKDLYGDSSIEEDTSSGPEKIFTDNETQKINETEISKETEKNSSVPEDFDLSNEDLSKKNQENQTPSPQKRSVAPIQVQLIDTNTPTTFFCADDDNTQTVVKRPRILRHLPFDQRDLTPTMQGAVDRILHDQDEDEPIGLTLAKEFTELLKTPVAPSSRKRFSNIQPTTKTPRRHTRAQIQRFLDVEEQSERNSFNNMSPSMGFR